MSALSDFVANLLSFLGSTHSQADAASGLANAVADYVAHAGVGPPPSGVTAHKDLIGLDFAHAGHDDFASAADLSGHAAETTDVHGVTAGDVESTTGAQAKVDAHATQAAPHTGHETLLGAAAKVLAHAILTTGVHGVVGSAVESVAGAAAKVLAHAEAATAHTAATNLEHTNRRGAANGYAGLNGSAKVVQDPASATATPAAGKIPLAGTGGSLAAWVPDATAGGKGLVQLAGQLGGSATSPRVVGLTESGGQALPLGAVADGQVLKRVGDELVGAAPGGGGRSWYGGW